MIRVGFILTFDATGWLGGISYFRNLLGALMALPGRTVEPVILAGARTDASVLAAFPRVQIVRSSLLDGGSTPFTLRRLVAKLLSRDVALEGLLRRNNIRALSHQGFFAGLGRIPVLGWIPDFQEKHFPNFFSAAELRARARKQALMSRVCSRLLLSSHDAQLDLQSIDPECAARGRVLQFVADVAALAPEEALTTARELGVDGPYFHLPNQFWVHKNHVVVVEALRVLKERGETTRVIATGNTGDHRQPGEFKALMRRVEAAGVADGFLTVGVLPHHKVMALMADSVAVINPSRFEGWSTTVEEAKSLGKKILLSDLRVHREQAPSRAHYFMPDDAERLAGLMTDALQAHDHALETGAMLAAQGQLPQRRQQFAERYQAIVMELIQP